MTIEDSEYRISNAVTAIDRSVMKSSKMFDAIIWASEHYNVTVRSIMKEIHARTTLHEVTACERKDEPFGDKSS